MGWRPGSLGARWGLGTQALSSKAAVVDTSVLHAYLRREDPLHEAAEALLELLDAVVVPSIVLHELVWSMRKKLGRVAAREAAERLLAIRGVTYEPVLETDIVFALADTRRYHDLLVVSVASRLGLPLATLDHGMARLARRHGVELVAVPRLARRIGV